MFSERVTCHYKFSEALQTIQWVLAEIAFEEALLVNVNRPQSGPGAANDRWIVYKSLTTSTSIFSLQIYAPLPHPNIPIPLFRPLATLNMFTNTISTAAAVLTFSLFVSADLNVGAGFVQVAKVPKVAVAGAGAAALVTINRHDVRISS